MSRLKTIGRAQRYLTRHPGETLILDHLIKAPNGFLARKANAYSAALKAHEAQLQARTAEQLAHASFIPTQE